MSLKMPSPRVVCISRSHFAVYARSLNYPVVYDDHPKIGGQPFIGRSGRICWQNFLDPNSQSSHATLNQHTYRPLFVLLTGIERRVFKIMPPGSGRSTFSCTGSMRFLCLCWRSAFLDGRPAQLCWRDLFFLIHPAQVESVVWVVEQSNIVCTALVPLRVWCCGCGTRFTKGMPIPTVEHRTVRHLTFCSAKMR